jgi:riboflavin kinase/FMN adenylyltransferase
MVEGDPPAIGGERGRFPGCKLASVITVGTFDGVHLGHRDILRHLHERASATGFAPVLVTFRPHPLAVVNPTAAPMLLSPDDEQLEALADSGPLLVAVLPFTPALARFSAADFVEHVLLDRYNMRELVIGYDHGLGRGREGDAATLTELGRRRGFRVDVVAAALDVSGAPVSSSDTLVDSRRSRAGKAPPGTTVWPPWNCRSRPAARARARRATMNIELPSPRKLLPPEYAVRAWRAERLAE